MVGVVAVTAGVLGGAALVYAAYRTWQWVNDAIEAAVALIGKTN